MAHGILRQGSDGQTRIDAEGAGWIQAEEDNRAGGYSMKIVWLRFEPTEIREIGVRVSSLMRRR